MEVFIIKALQLILALSLLVIVHEFGHYIFARIFGIRVEKFYLFFNPRFSLLRYVPERGRLEIGTWMDKDEKPHPLASFKVGRDYEATGDKVPSWKHTIYGIGWLPLGGYCAIAGMIDETQDASKLAAEPQAWEFRTKPAWQRLLVMCGGVIFNFILAVVIYMGVTYSYGERCVRFRDAYAGMDFVPAALAAGFQNGDIPLMADGREVEADTPNVMLELMQAHSVTVLRNGTDSVTINLPENFIFDLNRERGFFTYRLPVVVAEAIKGEPAADAGLRPGDRIVAVGDSLTPSFTELNAALAAYAAQPVALRVERDGRMETLTATPTEGGKLGFMLKPYTDVYPVFIREYGLLESVPAGWNLGTSTLGNYAKSMTHVFSKEGAESLGGFGALGSMFPERWNWYSFWMMTAFLSIALAFMNILPIPALDGGHVLFLLVEAVTRRKPSERFMEIAQTAGFFFLLALLLFANLNDIIRFLK